MVELLPTMVDTHIKEQVKKQVPEQVRDQVLVYVAEGLIIERQKTKEEMERMIAKAILQEALGNIQLESSSQIFMIRNWSYHIPYQVDGQYEGGRQEVIEYEESVSGEYRLNKVNEEDRDEEFLGKVTLVWESRKGFLVSLITKDTHLIFQSCKRDPEDPRLFMTTAEKRAWLWSLSVSIRSSVNMGKVHDFKLDLKFSTDMFNLTAPTILLLQELKSNECSLSSMRNAWHHIQE
ncbi:hypothetical protein Tco_0185955 [Tanacetum coccineum]